MDPATLSALIGGGIALGTSALNAGFTTSRNKASRKWTEEQWQRENEYNLPVNQVQRLKDAGLNPYLAYGQGSITGSTAAQSHNYNPEAIQFENPAPYLSAFAQTKKTSAEVDNVNQNTMLQAQQLRNLIVEEFLMKLQADEKSMSNSVFKSTMPYRLDEFKLNMSLINANIGATLADTQNSLAQKSLTLANTANMLLQNDYFHLDKQQQYRLQNISMMSTRAAINKMETETALLNKNLLTFDERFFNEMQGMKWNNMRAMYDMNQSKYDFFNKRYNYNIKTSTGYDPTTGGMFAPAFGATANFVYNFNKRPFFRFKMFK